MVWLSTCDQLLGSKAAHIHLRLRRKAGAYLYAGAAAQGSWKAPPVCGSPLMTEPQSRMCCGGKGRQAEGRSELITIGLPMRPPTRAAPTASVSPPKGLTPARPPLPSIPLHCLSLRPHSPPAHLLHLPQLPQRPVVKVTLRRRGPGRAAAPRLARARAAGAGRLLAGGGVWGVPGGWARGGTRAGARASDGTALRGRGSSSAGPLPGGPSPWELGRAARAPLARPASQHGTEVPARCGSRLRALTAGTRPAGGPAAAAPQAPPAAASPSSTCASARRARRRKRGPAPTAAPAAPSRSRPTPLLPLQR